jgi:hypothetical protein
MSKKKIRFYKEKKFPHQNLPSGPKNWLFDKQSEKQKGHTLHFTLDL